MARPPRAEAAGVPFQVRLSPAERERLEEAARVNMKSLAEFTRDAVMDAAEECLETPFVIQNPTTH